MKWIILILRDVCQEQRTAHIDAASSETRDKPNQQQVLDGFAENDSQPKDEARNA